jgi:hypothetical protein
LWLEAKILKKPTSEVKLSFYKKCKFEILKKPTFKFEILKKHRNEVKIGERGPPGEGL